MIKPKEYPKIVIKLKQNNHIHGHVVSLNKEKIDTFLKVVRVPSTSNKIIKNAINFS